MKVVKKSVLLLSGISLIVILTSLACNTNANKVAGSDEKTINDTIASSKDSVLPTNPIVAQPADSVVEPSDSTTANSEDGKNKQKEPQQSFEPHQGFVLVRDYVPDVIEDIRYYTTNNFMGAKVDGYNANAAIVTKQTARKLKEAADEFRTMGYVIKIYDAYRPQRAVNHFVRWAQGPDEKNKADYYPTIAKKNLFPRYIARKSGHSKGSTIDMTICYIDSKKEVDMGSHFDYFGPPSHTAYLGSYPGGNVNKQHNKNRMLLKRVMEKHGFTNYSNEWWHFTLNNQPYPNTYFDFTVRDK